MNKLKIVGIASLLGLSFLGEKYPNYGLINEFNKSSAIEENIIKINESLFPFKTKKKLMKKRIVYKNFSGIDFDEFQNEGIDSSYAGLINILTSNFPIIKDEKRLENIAFEEANKLGYNKDAVKNLGAEDALNLCIGIVINKINYFDVDKDENLRNLSIEDYLEIGKGDCDKYSRAFIAVFNVIKRYNKALENIFVSYGGLGGITINHSWNSILIPLKEKIILTHIDLTFYDQGKSIEAKRGYHLPEDDLELKAIFFSCARLYNESYMYYDSLIEKTANEKKKKEEILETMNRLAHALNDSAKMNKIEKLNLN